MFSYPEAEPEVWRTHGGRTGARRKTSAVSTTWGNGPNTSGGPARTPPPSTTGTSSRDGDTGATGEGRGAGAEDGGDVEGASRRSTAALGTPSGTGHQTEDGTITGIQAPPRSGAPSDTGRDTAVKGSSTTSPTESSSTASREKSSSRKRFNGATTSAEHPAARWSNKPQRKQVRG
ncbi:period circadian protein [Procambarus clarkii]|uniref:period circadian protein n=1 Tax=Procambarus clarkii TaxID=6728 RepID=UPI003743AC59